MTARQFSKLLIANRGEIACRIVATAHRMGYRTVAVFSSADARAPHVRAAGEAVLLGPPPASESYLRIGAILDAARKTGADAIHPGYGFLAENADFAEACAGAGLVFIGPSPGVIRAMGDKASAKTLALDAGVPCVPGYSGEDQSEARLLREAAQIGYPLLIKAVAGGGGRGIRAVRADLEFAAGLQSARREAESAFGDGRVMLERLVEDPRHIEVQVFGDSHGNAVHLFERDCTTQRRRQKLIEETPSPALTPEARDRITGYAMKIARAAKYENAGTVEFIADRHGGMYFLEMNTRLQVEHPVTEMVTGLDLVEWQLRIAAGEPLPLTQDEIRLHGHAIEARLCTEDPYDGFRPQTGTVAYWRPAPEAGLRIDSGVDEDGEITPFYDSMVAKIVVHGRTRADAVRRLACALENHPLLGPATNASFLRDLLRTQDFAEASLATNTIDQWMDSGAAILNRPVPAPEAWAIAAALFAGGDGSHGWFRSAGPLDAALDLDCGGETKQVRYGRRREGIALATVDGQDIALTLDASRHPGNAQSTIRALDDGADVSGPGYRQGGFGVTALRSRAVEFTVEGVARKAIAVRVGRKLYLSVSGTSFIFSQSDSAVADEAEAAGRIVKSPVSGVAVKVPVRLGESVSLGQTLAVIEAMKMETRVAAQTQGKITGLHISEGAQVQVGAAMFEIEPEGEGDTGA